ncbi:phosphoadenosine phosphosulfate reductase family protein [Lutibacter sp.]|uniref:phosphoadenosine phosphosulfate reductase domain-containing protein n=1 Tax=Lutibacter sp. TaxID=1925666 RepID=UPI0025C35885|nr:phosphoadenosine phosphosulfate reductase family protein [Lutibacter sp.]MCF6169254.1 phosphoadenosine phosphosulfate reductase family protein [Lutibacter sp.]
MNNLNLKQVNKELQNKSPEQIIAWAINSAKRPLVTTNFRPYEVAILHACTQVEKNLKVIWCDTGYNTPQTYAHANELIDTLDLNIHLYVPKQTAAHRDVTIGIPQIEDPLHILFTEQVKLEPFNRAMQEHKPDVWFTNLRKGQTAFRSSIDIVSLSKDGVLKVSPFYHWTDEELDNYLKVNGLPNEFTYFDPTKVLENRECGLHS